MQNLCDQIEALRDELQTQRLDEDHVWQLLQRVDQMLEASRGTEYEASLQTIYSMLDSLWRSTRAQAQLRKAARGL